MDMNMNTRSRVQNVIGLHCEEMMGVMFDIAKENYLNGNSQRAIKEYSSILADESLNLQFRVAFMRPAEQEKIYTMFSRRGKK